MQKKNCYILNKRYKMQYNEKKEKKFFLFLKPFYQIPFLIA